MLKLENKFFTLLLLTAVGVLFSGYILFFSSPDFRNFSNSGKIIHSILKNKIFALRIENEIHRSGKIPTDEFRANIEQSLRYYGMPFSAMKIGALLKNKLSLSNLRIYDNAFRLIYSEIRDNEIFNRELRFSDIQILPGTFSKIGEFEIYRSLDGMYFFRFNYLHKNTIAKKMKIPFESKYWVFEKTDHSVYFTNDIGIISGAEKDIEVYNKIVNDTLESLKEIKKIILPIGLLVKM